MRSLVVFGVAVFLILGFFAHANPPKEAKRSISRVKTEKFECVIEHLLSEDVSSEELFLAEDDQLYAPVFKGDEKSKNGGIKPISRIEDDRVFVQSYKNGNKTTVNLTLFGGAASLKQWKYAERFEASGGTGVQIRLGFCTSREVK